MKHDRAGKPNLLPKIGVVSIGVFWLAIITYILGALLSFLEPGLFVATLALAGGLLTMAAFLGIVSGLVSLVQGQQDESK